MLSTSQDESNLRYSPEESSEAAAERSAIGVSFPRPIGRLMLDDELVLPRQRLRRTLQDLQRKLSRLSPGLKITEQSATHVTSAQSPGQAQAQ